MASQAVLGSDSISVTVSLRSSTVTDTLGPENQFAVQRFPLFRGYFMCIAIYLDPYEQSATVCQTPLLGEFVIRGSLC
jgi:hypothetical protein